MKKIILLVCLSAIILPTVGVLALGEEEATSPFSPERIRVLGKMLGSGILTPSSSRSIYALRMNVGKISPFNFARVRQTGIVVGLRGGAGGPTYAEEVDVSTGTGSIIDPLLNIFQPFINLIR